MARGRALADRGRYRRVALFSVDGTRSSRQDSPIRGLVHLFYFVLVRVSVECLCVLVFLCVGVSVCWCVCVRAQACGVRGRQWSLRLRGNAKFVTSIVAAETHANSREFANARREGGRGCDERTSCSTL